MDEDQKKQVDKPLLTPGFQDKRVLEFIGFDNNTHYPELDASACTVLLRLQKIYRALSEDKLLEELESAISARKDARLWEAWLALKQKIKSEAEGNESPETHRWKMVTLWKDGEEKKVYMPLKTVVALVYAAFTDETVAFEEKDTKLRIAHFFKAIEDLHFVKKICPTGDRNDLVSSLENIYPDVKIVRDFVVYLSDIFAQLIKNKLDALKLNNPKIYNEILLTYLVFEQSFHPALSALYNSSEVQSEAKRLMIKGCEDNGINPIANASKINGVLKQNDLIPLIIGEDSVLNAIVRLLKIKVQEKDTEMRKKAVEVVINSIKPETFNLFNEEDQLKLNSFMEIEEIYNKHKNYHAAFYNWNDEKIPENDKVSFINFINLYYQSCLEHKKPCLPTTEFRQFIEKFNLNFTHYKKDAEINWVENFFAFWVEAVHDRSLDKLNHLSQRFLNPLIQEKVFISDHVLNLLFNNTQSVIYLSPYFINRIFLHALMNSPALWTKTFYQNFREVLLFVKDGFHAEDNRFIAQELKINSYPSFLISQLDWLQKYYEYCINPKQEDAEIKHIPFKLYLPMIIFEEKNFWELCGNENGLYLACQFNQSKQAENFIDELSAISLYYSEFDFSLMDWVIYHTNINIFKRLLKKDSSINELAGLGHNTLLHLAAERGFDEAVAILVEKNPNLLQVRNLGGFTPIQLASLYKHWGTVKVIANAQISPIGDAYLYGSALVTAAEHNQGDLVCLLLDKGAIPNWFSGREHYSAFHWAANYNNKSMLWHLLEKFPALFHILLASTNENMNKKVIEMALEKFPKLINQIDQNGNTLLHLAAEKGFSTIVSFLIENGADFQKHNYTKKTPIQLAEDNKNWETVKAIVNTNNFSDVNPFYYEQTLLNAAINNQADVVLALLEKKINAQWYILNLYPIHWAAYHNNLEMLAHILKKFPKCIFNSLNSNDEKLNKKVIEMALETFPNAINHVDENGNTLLHLAAEKGFSQIVLYLIQNEADLAKQNNNKKTPVELAIDNNYWETVTAIAKAKNSPKNDPFHFGNALLMASKFNKAAIFFLLLEKGASLAWRDNDTLRFTIHWAAHHDNKEMIWRILEINPNCIFYSLKSNDDNLNKKVIEIALEKYPNIVSQADYNNNTLLHLAAEKGLSQIVLYLIQNRADLAKQNNNKKTPVELAIDNNYWETVTAIAKAKNSPESDPFHFGNALLMASKFNKAAIFFLLLEKGASLAWRDNDTLRFTIHWAAHHDNKEMIWRILEINPNCIFCSLKSNDDNLNKKVIEIALEKYPDIVSQGGNNNNNTLLHLAAEKGLSQIVLYLIQNGADLAMQNKYNKTPIELALDNNHWETVAEIAKAKSSPEKDSFHYGSALLTASKVNKTETCFLLLEKGASLTWSYSDTKFFVYHWAVINNNIAILRRIFFRDLSLGGHLFYWNEKDKIQLLHFAVEKNSPGSAFFLLSYIPPPLHRRILFDKLNSRELKNLFQQNLFAKLIFMELAGFQELRDYNPEFFCKEILAANIDDILALKFSAHSKFKRFPISWQKEIHETMYSGMLNKKDFIKQWLVNKGNLYIQTMVNLCVDFLVAAFDGHLGTLCYYVDQLFSPQLRPFLKESFYRVEVINWLEKTPTCFYNHNSSFGFFENVSALEKAFYIKLIKSNKPVIPMSIILCVLVENNHLSFCHSSIYKIIGGKSPSETSLKFQTLALQSGISEQKFITFKTLIQQQFTYLDFDRCQNVVDRLEQDWNNYDESKNDSQLNSGCVIS